MIDAKAIVDRVAGLIPPGREMIGLHEPTFKGNEWRYLKDCLDTGWVSSVGKYVDNFEEKLTEFTGAKHAVATVNGTAALHASLALLDIGFGDEVLVPALTFVGTVNAIRHAGATPHFVDSDEKTLGVDPAKLENHLSRTLEIRGGRSFNKTTGKPVRALIAVHIFGHPADLDSLSEICRRNHLFLIEDAAESLGSYYKGRHTGNSGILSTLSFNGNKTVTTGGGGAILTNDPALAKKAKHLTTTAKTPHPWKFDHDAEAFNYRMPNINAALGCAQLEQLPGFLKHKRLVAEFYRDVFKDLPGGRLFWEPEFAQSNFWLNALVLDARDSREKTLADRDALLEAFHRRGIGARPVWTLMHKLPMYVSFPRADLSTAEDLEARIVNLPSSPFLAGMLP